MKSIKKNSIGQIVLNAFFIIASITYIIPFVLIISISISDESAIQQFGYTILPKVVSFAGYQAVFKNPAQLIQSYKITAIFSVANTALFLLLCSMAAYPLSRRNYKIKTPITWFLFVPCIFSGGLVPTYLLMSKYLHLSDSIWVYIIPGCVNIWNCFVMRTFFQNLPDGIVEAAKVDGASEVRVLFQILMPLCLPMLASLGFLHFIAKWNDWKTVLYYITDPKLYSLQYLLQKILREQTYLEQMVEEGLMSTSSTGAPIESMTYAMAILAAGPMLIIFPFFQKYFESGLTIGSVKG